MGFMSKLGGYIVGEGNDFHLGGAHNWLFGGDASKQANAEIRPQQYQGATNVLGDMANTAQARQAPQTGPYAQAGNTQLGAPAQLAGGQMAQSRGGMMGTADRLGAIAGGQQAGAGELAVNRQVSSAAAGQVAAARMARGANAALAYRNAARNTADIGLAGAGQAAGAQMQDQQAANAQLGQLYGSMYGQDAQVAAQNAQLGQQAMLQQGSMDQQTALANQQAAQQTQLANLQARLAQSGMNDQQQQAAMAQLLGWDTAAMQAAQARAGIVQGDKGIVAGLFSGGGQALAAISDERLKTDIADGGADADELMASLRPKSYRYKDEAKHGEGARLGIMAQDLARSKMGRAAVVKVDDEGHIGFDLGKAASAALASVARLHERVSKLEGAA